ncbi:MAG TPA: sugar nucleotide-binding protein [Bacteriovoracaceae bacterium]|nr:sugar nucleotide-binding protein [Bacteriovoracaceae bacterium]
MKNILVLGANSYVGYYLARQLNSKNKVVGLSRKEVHELENITQVVGDPLNVALIGDLVKKHHIQIVINCVCIGNVDQCEREPDVALKINYEHVENLVGLSEVMNFKLIHFSSNAVYCGDRPEYSEESLKEPKNYYGKVKAMADDLIKKELSEFLLIRVMTLYGPKKEFHRANPASMIIKALEEDKPLKLVNDLFGNLLFIGDLVSFVDEAIIRGFSGEFNIAGDDIVSRHELGLLVCELMEKPMSLISACASDEFPSLAPRAYNTSFDNTKVKSALNKNSMTPIKTGLLKTLKGYV